MIKHLEPTDAPTAAPTVASEVKRIEKILANKVSPPVKPTRAAKRKEAPTVVPPWRRQKVAQTMAPTVKATVAPRQKVYAIPSR